VRTGVTGKRDEGVFEPWRLKLDVMRGDPGPVEREDYRVDQVFATGYRNPATVPGDRADLWQRGEQRVVERP
jgi:hypothetical protein